MRKILLIGLLILGGLCVVNLKADPVLRAKAERSEYHGANGVLIPNAVVLHWDFTQTGTTGSPQSFEIQRKLFPYSWIKKGVVSSSENLWIDKKPSKRASWYRVKAIYEDGSFDVSSKTFVNKTK